MIMTTSGRAASPAVSAGAAVALLQATATAASPGRNPDPRGATQRPWLPWRLLVLTGQG
jgi:hypothetical protein